MTDAEKVDVTSSGGAVVEHYMNKQEEKERFQDAMGQLEFTRTCGILERHLPRSGVVLDVGGGPGNYAKWLLERGFTMKLLDPVPKHIQQANDLFAEMEVESRAQADLGSAVSLPYQDYIADALLFMGPLYHLVEAEHREAALKEALRVMKSGSYLFAAGISRFASLLDGLDRGFVWNPTFQKIIRQDLVNGQHRNPTTNAEYFTDVYMSRPNDLAAEVRDAGFEVVRTLGIEGPLLMDQNFDQDWQDQGRRALLLEFVEQVEEEPSLLGMSPHYLIIAKKA